MSEQAADPKPTGPTHDISLKLHADGRITQVHGVTSVVGGHSIRYREEIELDEVREKAVRDLLAGLIEEDCECGDDPKTGLLARAEAAAIAHAANLNKKARPGVKRIKVGGELKAAGGLKTDKKG